MKLVRNLSLSLAAAVGTLAFGSSASAFIINSTDIQSGTVSFAAGGDFVEPTSDDGIINRVGSRNIPTRDRAIYRFDLSPLTAPVQSATFEINLLNESLSLEDLRDAPDNLVPHLRFEILNLDRDVDVTAANGTANGPLAPDVALANGILIGDFEINETIGITDPAEDNQLFSFDVTSFLESDRVAGFTNSTFRITLVDQNGSEINATNANAQVSESARLDVTLVPEPGSIAVLGLGLVCIGARRRGH